MSQALKPCPFCGEPAEGPFHIDNDWTAECLDSECKVNATAYAKSEDAVVIAWNRRHPSEREKLLEKVAEAGFEDKCPRAHSANLTYALAALQAYDERIKEKGK